MSTAVWLGELLDERSVLLPLAGSSGGRVLLEFAELAAERGWVGEARELAAALEERESLGTTAVGEGVAVPHAKLDSLAGLRIAAGVSRRGIDFGAADGQPTRLFFLLLAPPLTPSLHIQALAQVSRIARVPGLTRSLAEAPSAEEFLARLRAMERQS